MMKKKKKDQIILLPLTAFGRNILKGVTYPSDILNGGHGKLILKLL